MTPEAKVGKTANLVIFLGILYTGVNLIGLIRGKTALAGWRGPAVLAGTLGIVALGYGIRYGSAACLHAARGVFVVLLGYFAYSLATLPAWRPAVRLVLSSWAGWRLSRTIPAMRLLHQTGSQPLGTSRYKEFFVRRKIGRTR
jgi:hypothetical protein